ncbi:MAG: ROK family protein [Candidatus Neomarinimicrobiota bacterium]
MARLLAGLDIGGTHTTVALFDDDLELVERCRRVETSALNSGDELVAQVLASIDAGLAACGGRRSDLAGIGIGAPGPLDLETGTVLETPNTPILNQYPLRERMSEASGLPVRVDNDANIFTLGEALKGAAQGYPYVLGVTLGTGFGWGIVLDGKVYHGATGTAGEYGLTPWRREGRTWEDDVSIQGLMSLHNDRGGTASSPKEVAAQAQRGDELALEAWGEYGQVLGFALCHGVNLLDPHIIVVGGAMVGAWDYFSPTMDETLRSHIFARPREKLKVVPSKLGDLSALVGAASQISRGPD